MLSLLDLALRRRPPALVRAPGPKTFLVNVAAIGLRPTPLELAESPGHIVVRVKGEIQHSVPTPYMIHRTPQRWWRQDKVARKLLPTDRTVLVSAETIADIDVEFTGALGRLARRRIEIEELV